jgi:hypothetical protein
MVIGLDFDNTIVGYDDLILRAAVSRGLVPAGQRANKKEVRDRIRELPDGEIEWQKVQALVYGPMMPEARMFEGVEPFVRRSVQSGIPVFIISHKTELAGYDETGTNLRDASLAWMTTHGFFLPDGLGLSPAQVIFEGTRAGKLQRIRELKCTLFVDDLEEVLLEPDFPRGVTRVLFAPALPLDLNADPKVVPDWQALTDYVFAHAR